MGKIKMLGALAGDIIGSVYEFCNTKSTDFDLFCGASVLHVFLDLRDQMYVVNKQHLKEVLTDVSPVGKDQLWSKIFAEFVENTENFY